MNADPLLQGFFEEATELLADFEAGLLRLETTPEDSELLNRIFRAAHTLKGNSAMLGLDEIAHFTHALEDLLDRLRKGQRRVTPALVNTLLASADVLRVLLERARAGGGQASPEDQASEERVLEGIHALVSGKEPVVRAQGAPAPAAPAAAAAERTLFEIRFHPPGDLLRRGLDPIQLVSQLEELGELLRVDPDLGALPVLASMDPEQSYLAWTIWLLSDRPQAEVAARFDFVGDPAAVTIEALPMGEAAAPRAAGGEAPGPAGRADGPAGPPIRWRPRASASPWIKWTA